jgi:ABC-2 type transport system permease protein
MSRDLERPLPFARAAGAVFALGLEGSVWTRRTVVMAVLLGLPALFAVLYRLTLAARMPASVSPGDLYGSIVALYYVRNAVPLAALFYATALIADEIEQKTITHLFTRPITRLAILSGKFAAYVATTLSLALPTLTICFLLLASARGLTGLGDALVHLPRDLGVVTLGFLSYGAFFTFLGVALRRPVLPGLLFLFLWELLVNMPGDLPRLTITAWLRSLLLHRPAEEGLLARFFMPVTLPAGESLGVLLVFTAACLTLAAVVFGRRDYVLEQ